MIFDPASALTGQLVAQVSLVGMGLDMLGGCYLAYDLLGGKHGPLRTITRAAGYIALFFTGYLLVLGVRYGMVAAVGMGILLAIEYRIAGGERTGHQSRSVVVGFGFLRGVVLGLAAMTIAGARFGLWFGFLSGLGLGATYSAGLAPTDDYEAGEKPSVSRHKLVASLARAIAVGLAGIVAGFAVISPAGKSAILGLRLGAAAGAVSALVGLFSPVIEWKIENLPERRMGVIGLAMIVVGMTLQSVQYWLTVFGISPR